VDERPKIVFSRRSIRRALGIPDEIGMASVLCLGHPVEAKEPRT
jgi:hypothetical protein